MMFCRMKGTIKLCEELVGVFVQVESDVKEGDGLSVGFGGDPQPIVSKDAVYLLFDGQVTVLLKELKSIVPLQLPGPRIEKKYRVLGFCGRSFP